MSKSAQTQHQLNYFGKEFSRLRNFSLVPWQQAYVDRIRKFLPRPRVQKPITVLDVATGSGYAAIELAQSGYKVLACDLTPQSISYVKKWSRKLGLKNLRAFVSRAEKINLPSRSVDFIIANAILEHIERESETISEWTRILKPGGRIFITVPLKFRYLWPFLIPFNYWYDRRISHLRRYSDLELTMKFSFVPIQFFYTGHLVKYLGLFLSLLKLPDSVQVWIENLDARLSNRAYGASNLIAVLQKPA